MPGFISFPRETYVVLHYDNPRFADDLVHIQCVVDTSRTECGRIVWRMTVDFTPTEPTCLACIIGTHDPR